jgi:hypothetical protein
VSVDGRLTVLRKGVCVYIPAGAVHAVAAAPGSTLDCLSINEGIIDPAGDVDIDFAATPEETGGFRVREFAQQCVDKARSFSMWLRAQPANGVRFSVTDCPTIRPSAPSC